jgi:hypothetical protein
MSGKAKFKGQSGFASAVAFTLLPFVFVSPSYFVRFYVESFHSSRLTML